MTYACPVCAYGMSEPACDFNVCPCCGTEFGLHDKNSTLEALRALWIANGMQWWSKVDEVPPDWDPAKQMANLELTV